MKYNIGDSISINNTDWTISEHRMGRGREWTYTLSHKDIDGSYINISLNKRALDGITINRSLVNE